MTTRWKTAVIAGIAAATATVAASAWATSRGDEPASAQDTTVPDTSAPAGTGTDDEGRRTITVSGHGSVDVTPDIAHLEMGVQATAPASQEALDQVAAKSETLVESLKALGIAARDIQTSGLNLWPQYDNDGQQITGYQGSVSVSITARDIDELGTVIDGVSALVGDNLTLGGIWFDYDDPESVLADARTAAIANARERAAQYAAAAGADVGEIVRISETVAGGPVPLEAEFSRASAGDVAADVAIEPGRQELSVDVSVVFEMS
jgi:uncharacterized protein YggE